jgi:D-cysteine desulfhydrase
MAELAAELRKKGRKPYVIPYGGSNAVGATGYVMAMAEFMEQMQQTGQKIDAIVVASSSGGTQAGLVVGARATRFSGKIIGIRIDKKDKEEISYETELAQLANETAQRNGLEAGFVPEDFTVDYGYLGAGYGVVGALEIEAITLTARLEGLFLDPVYTGRAMGGLLDLIRRHSFAPQEAVLFWHTGGAPALFAYAREIQ